MVSPPNDEKLCIDEQAIVQATSCPAVSDEYARHLLTLYAEKQWDGLPPRDDLVTILEKARETEETANRHRLTTMLAGTYTPGPVHIDGTDALILLQGNDRRGQEWFLQQKPYTAVISTVDICRDFSPSYCKQDTTWRRMPWWSLLLELRAYAHEDGYRKERSLWDILKSGADALAMLLPFRIAHGRYVQQNYDECTKAYATLKRVLDHVIEAYRSSEQKESR